MVNQKICNHSYGKNLCTKSVFLSEIFPNTFCCCCSVVKNQFSIQFWNSIFHLCHFNNLYFSTVVQALSLIHYPLEKSTSKQDNSGEAFSSNLAGFKLQNFDSLLWAAMEALWVPLIKVNRNHKIQPSKQKRW